MNRIAAVGARTVTMAILAGSAVTAGAATAQAGGDLYGAIAYSDGTGIAAAATNFGDSRSADTAARGNCGRGDCRVVLDFHNGCGALAQGADHRVSAGWGPTKVEAEQRARDFLGPSAPPFPDLGSAAPRAATIALSTCTSNAH